MRRSVTKLVGAVTAVGAIVSLSACGGVASSGDGAGLPSWQGANYLPESNSFSRALVNVSDFLVENEIAETNIFHQEALLGASDILPGIADGRANIGIINPFYYPGELPLTNVASVPFVSQDPWAYTTALNEVYDSNEDLQAEYSNAGVELVAFVPVSTAIVGTKDPIEALEDFDGQQIRAVGLLSDAVAELGANPTAMGAGEIYQGIEQGVIDGYTSYPFDIAIQNSFHEVAPNMVDPGSGVYSVGAIMMNKGNWDELTDEQRSAVESNRRAFGDEASQMVVDDLQAECDVFTESGGSLTQLPVEEIEKFEDTVGDSLLESWKSDSTAAGVEAAAADGFLEELQAGIEPHEAAPEFDLTVQPCIDQAG